MSEQREILEMENQLKQIDAAIDGCRINMRRINAAKILLARKPAKNLWAKDECSYDSDNINALDRKYAKLETSVQELLRTRTAILKARANG